MNESCQWNYAIVILSSVFAVTQCICYSRVLKHDRTSTVPLSYQLLFSLIAY